MAIVSMWVVSALALVIYTRGARAATEHELVIPRGTAQRIAAGENPLEIPSSWSFYADDLLVLKNEDVVGHWFGSFFAPPGTTSSYELQPVLGVSFFCSLHPDGAIAIAVQPRGFDLGQTIVPTFVLGPAVGLVVLGVKRVMRALDEPEPAASADPLAW